MRRLPRRNTSRVSHERWLVSYADFMTLLFAFFATMYAISSVDAQKLTTLATALESAFTDSQHAVAVQRADRESQSSAAEQAAAGVQEQVRQQLAAELNDARIEMTVDRRGVILSIPEAGTFPVGSDDLSDTAQRLVTRVGEVLGGFSNAVRVEGHTDDIPIHNQRFASNWDLSAARASRVVELLMAHGLPPDRLSATGYAEFHPRVANESASSRASNRRIDLVILNQATASNEEPAAPLPAP